MKFSYKQFKNLYNIESTSEIFQEQTKYLIKLFEH